MRVEAPPPREALVRWPAGILLAARCEWNGRG